MLFSWSDALRIELVRIVIIANHGHGWFLSDLRSLSCSHERSTRLLNSRLVLIYQLLQLMVLKPLSCNFLLFLSEKAMLRRSCILNLQSCFSDGLWVQHLLLGGLHQSFQIVLHHTDLLKVVLAGLVEILVCCHSLLLRLLQHLIDFLLSHLVSVAWCDKLLWLTDLHPSRDHVLLSIDSGIVVSFYINEALLLRRDLDAFTNRVLLDRAVSQSRLHLIHLRLLGRYFIEQ